MLKILPSKLAICIAVAGACLSGSAQAGVSMVDPASTEKLDSRDPNYMRCRRIQVTGSLVKKERICKTNAEWARVAEDMQRNADNLIGRNRTGNDCRAGGPGC